MKILLTEPPMPTNTTPSPPLGLAYLAACLEQEQHEVKIIDPVLFKYKLRHIQREIKKFNPDAVGVSAMTPYIYDAFSIIEYAKKNNPNCLTILGGPHPTLLSRETLEENKYLDVVVRGEGEITITELIRKNNVDTWKNVKGITWRNNEKIIYNPERELIENLDELPLPAYHLLSMDKYKVKSFEIDMFEKRGQQYFTMFTSRGCPLNCAFCSSCRIWGRKWRCRSPEKVLEELKLLVYKYNKKVIKFIDDSFTLNADRAKKICKLIKDEGLDISLVCITRVDNFDEEMALALKNAGCFLIFFGIESGVQETLDFLGKGFTLQQAEKAVSIAKKLGLEASSGFIIGVPGETTEKIHQTIHFARKLNLRSPKIFILTPFPGTKIYDIAQEKNLLLTNDWSKYNLHTPVMNVPGFTIKELKKLKRKAHLMNI